MSVYNYENITYEITGMSVINDPKDTKQEGLLIRLRRKDMLSATEATLKMRGDKLAALEIFVDKRNAAHIAKITQTGRQYWKRFHLPKMKEQRK